MIFLISVIGNGSTRDPSIQMGFRISEQICQAIFLAILILRLLAFGSDAMASMVFDLLMAVCSFVGLNIQDQEVARYFLCARVLKLGCMFVEVPELKGEMEKLIKSLKMASSILLPTLLFIYIYAVVGLHCFSGTFAFI